ncbi:uncharacterized protein LOC116341966 [Contarinia nasturtii]|uniref:uncharacterized protein LOC116341966 n=1 Tax=Contarinia nasturtii TaxID=265458 RepID=UPI0012D4459A|nr:uncharacterized protein LOC116341966 [Contarinia nasturtii]
MGKHNNIVENFKIKPCEVRLERLFLSKIRIRCTATSSEKNDNLVCHIKQDEINTFSIRIKRKNVDRMDNNKMNPRKRVKFIHENNTSSDDIITNGSEQNRKKIRSSQRKTGSKSTRMDSDGMDHDQISQNSPIGIKNVIFKAPINDEPKCQPKKMPNKQRALTTVKKIPKHAEVVQIDEVVLCKMRGFCHWPCRIIELNEELVNVRFFGDNTTYKTTIKNIFKFEDCADIILSNLKGRKNQLYSKSVQEAELVLGVPSKNSIMKQLERIR